MKTKLLAALLVIAAIGWVQADQAVVASPNTVQTMAYSNITHKVLKWNATDRSLTAIITFSNRNYVSSVEPRYDQTVAFTLAGIRYDKANGTFFANGIPVANTQSTLIGQELTLAPGARIMALDNHGKISVMLVASRTPITGSHWVRVQETPELHRMFARASGMTRPNRG